MKLPLAVTHYSKNDPTSYRGGVETFARTLGLFFEDVEFMCPRTLDAARVFRESRMVIADNQWADDWPEPIPVVAFQHGVAHDKAAAVGGRGALRIAQQQARAARRSNTIWVACAEWISRRFAELHGNAAAVVIQHPVDLERFDGRREACEPDLVLHDARSEHKGRELVARLSGQFPAWRLEPLRCEPGAVPARMAKGRAFVHLSRYEGNSIVVNEALAMNLPCFLTDVGLMRDENRPADVHVVSAQRAFADPEYLRREFEAFLASLATRSYRPREWAQQHAGLEVVARKWERVAELWKPLQRSALAADPRAGDLARRLVRRPVGTLGNLLRRCIP